MNATFYCDESGYTGPNWLDSEQDIFVQGGWLIPDVAATQVETILSSFKSRLSIRSAEIKWKNLRKKSDRSSAFSTLFEQMLEIDAVPCFMIVEKNYLIATKAVELFFDPLYNTRLNMSFTSEFGTKIQLAHALLADGTILKIFAGWILKPEQIDHSNVQELAALISSRLASHNYPRFAKTLMHFEANEIEGMIDELNAEVWKRTETGHTLLGVLQHVESVVRTKKVAVHIVHDEFNHIALKNVAERLMRPEEQLDKAGPSNLLKLMPTASGIELVDSRNVVQVQAADLLCGYLRETLSSMKKGKSLSSDDRSVARALLELYSRGIESWSFLASRDICEGYWSFGLETCLTGAKITDPWFSV